MPLWNGWREQREKQERKHMAAIARSEERIAAARDQIAQARKEGATRYKEAVERELNGRGEALAPSLPSVDSVDYK